MSEHPTPERRVMAVTGGARGLGLAIAEEFVAAGDAVALLDIDEEAVHAAADELSAAGHDVLPIVCDVRSRTSVDDAIERTVERFGRLDVAVSNAGVVRDELYFRMTDDEWDTVIATHLTGAFYFTRAAQAHMVRQQYGKIVFISSRAALGGRGQANYSTAKAGLQGLTRTLAIELGPFGINVNAVAPGHVDTDMTRGVAERLGITYEELKQTTIDANSIKRVGRVEDVSKAVHFLASDHASYITGQILYITGRPTV